MREFFKDNTELYPDHVFKWVGDDVYGSYVWGGDDDGLYAIQLRFNGSDTVELEVCGLFWGDDNEADREGFCESLTFTNDSQGAVLIKEKLDTMVDSMRAALKKVNG